MFRGVEYFFALSLVLALGHGAPVDNSEVELIEPVSSHGDQSPDSTFFNTARSPIFIVHGNFPRLDLGQNPFPRNAFPFSFGDIFGLPPRRSSQEKGNDETIEDVELLSPPSSKPNCGIFCQLFKDLDSLHQFPGAIFESIRPPSVPPRKGNSTYTEKVLPDGSIVRVNSTTYSDSDDNGNAFFFQSSTHFVDGGKDEPEEATTVDEDKENDNEKKSPEGPTKASQTPVVQIIPDEEIGFKLPEDFDPNLNEVSEIQDAKRSKRSGGGDLPTYGNHPSPTEELIPIGDSDVRVNELISESANKGSLIQTDPDSELIVEVEEGVVVPYEEWSQQREQQESTWNTQQRSEIVFPDH